MCGILVVWSKPGAIDGAACRRALSTMAWRGPDFSVSRIWNGRLFLGQAVLSLTGDPAASENYQRSRSGRFELMYNGELYNCPELQAAVLDRQSELAPRTRTDTELLVNLHERLPAEEVPQRLDGMFAYALFDEPARRLAIVRDPQGEKRLYVYDDERVLVVASEIRAILSLAPQLEPDPQALRDYFRTRHLMLGARTVYGGIRELSPGAFESLDLESGRWTCRRFGGLRGWVDPARMEANTRRPADDLADELGSLLDRCVREMLPVDRRYAVVVSGGIDSAIVAESIVRQGSPDMLVAVDHVGQDPLTADLSGFERALGRPVTKVSVDPAAYAAEIPRCQRAVGGPLPAHSFVAQSQQSAVIRAAGCRAVFGGDGADELFGGYSAYLECGDPLAFYSHSPYTAHREPIIRFHADDPRAMQHDLSEAWTAARATYAHVDSACDRRRLAMMLCDAEYQLPAVALRSTDTMSMMWSVEGRSVFLRKPLVQFALNLPAAVKADPRGAVEPLLRTKPLLKRLFLRRFPRELLKEKRGFGGFPNQSLQWLGRADDFLALDVLGVEPASLAAAMADRDEAWKLTNIEYFLRHATR
jgi:asparagine synthase (glutamine-hydrolysing)